MLEKLKIVSVYAIDKRKLNPYWLVYFNRPFKSKDFNDTVLKSIALPTDHWVYVSNKEYLSYLVLKYS